jgi:hypothetical protein
MSGDESAPTTGLAAAIGGIGGLLTGHGASASGGSGTLSAVASLTATSSSISAVSATLTRHEFRDLSVAAGRAALSRLENKTGADPRDIFAETGEVLFWLYALGDIGDDKPNVMSPGLQSVRHCYAHGNLLTAIVDYQLVFVLDETTLDASLDKREHLWSERVLINPKARDSKKQRDLESKYRTEVATRPVVVTLRDELNRLAALTCSTAQPSVSAASQEGY